MHRTKFQELFSTAYLSKKAVFAEKANTAVMFHFPEVTPEESSDRFYFCSLAISARNSDNVPEGSFRPLVLAA